jgi:hypothetical protein
MQFETFFIAEMPDGTTLRADVPQMALDTYRAKVRRSGINPKLPCEHTIRITQDMIHAAIVATEAFIGREATQPEAHEAWERCAQFSAEWTPSA